MKFSELLDYLAKHYPERNLREWQAFAESLREEITHQLSSGNRIELRGFGNFSRRAVAAKHSVHPKTGDPMVIPARHQLHYRPSSTLLAKLNSRL